MATEAQVSANRRNAAKSTGPRTKQGKAIVAQNALRHGLLARQHVVAGEDPGQFEFHRRSMLAEMRPAGPTETLLAERIVGLAWRLMRAERMQNQVFDYLLGRELDGSTFAFPDLLTEKEVREMCGSCRSDPGLAVGRMLVKDCRRDKVLERLMLYEQRIESSLRRAIRDLRDLRAERAPHADGPEFPARWEPQPACRVPEPACPESVEGRRDVEASSGKPARETSNVTPQALPTTRDGVTTNETDPVKQTQSAAGVAVSGADSAKQTQSGTGGSGLCLPGGSDSAKQSQSAAAGGQASPDLEKQTQPGDEASCETKPMEADGPVRSVPARAYDSQVSRAGCDVCVRAY